MKTNETSNQMGKCEKCGATQFLSYGICNYNGICNGKIIPIKISTREQAIAWWKQLTDGRRNYFIGYHLFQFRDQDSLTGREIEEIWMKETQNNIVNWDENPETILKDKPNQKQFKQFDESLFKAYINKFSDEDKLKAFKTFKTQISDMLYKFAEIVDDSYRPVTRDNMNGYMAIPEFKKQEGIE